MTTTDGKETAPDGSSDVNPPKRAIDALLDVMAALRTPVTGCPWDLEQDFASIAPYTVEEAYEVADAIERDDAIDLQDELGDLLLQVVYHARMAEERGLFDFEDVARGITEKMVRRHPHVFGTPDERAAGPVKGSWDRIKRAEKNMRQERMGALPADKRTLSGNIRAQQQDNSENSTQANTPERTLRDVPATLPSLVRAIKLQSKAARVGFDWPSLTPVFAKMKEELEELEAAHRVDTAKTERTTPNAQEPEKTATPSAHVVEEFGDLLFVIANVARHMKIDAEAALASANQKFIRRFEAVEDRLAADGKTPSQSNLEEMDTHWDAVKVSERTETS